MRDGHRIDKSSIQKALDYDATISLNVLEAALFHFHLNLVRLSLACPGVREALMGTTP